MALSLLPACRATEPQLSDAPPPPSPQQIALERIEGLTPQLSAELATKVAATPAEAEPEALLTAFAAEYGVSDRNLELLREVLGELGGLFAARSGLTQSGEAVMATLGTVWDHALFPTDYHVYEAMALADRLERQAARARALSPVELQPDDQAQLAQVVSEQPELRAADDETLLAFLTDQLVPSAEARMAGSPVARVTEQLAEYAEVLAVSDQIARELDLVLADAFLRLASDMRFANPAWFPEDVREDEELLEAARREALLGAFRRGAGDEGFAPVLAELPPHHEQYGRLVEAHRRYRAWAAAGGWGEPLPSFDISTGDSHEAVPALRARLAMEGYFEGDLESDGLDGELEQALMHYQRTHQFSEEGRIRRGVINSLNVPALERARQVAVALQRWRESGIGDDPYYVFINIPDFHGEVWRDGHRDMRFRIIVGENSQFVRGVPGPYPRATPELDATMRSVVFNPYWAVPEGIMITEYDPFLEEDPNWYEHNGYEVMFNEDGTRWVRQLPGPDNALGVVKFMFPNPHYVFMHDTPAKRLFDRPMRDYSHGCMRVQDPLDLAEYILHNDRGWTREDMDSYRRSDSTELWLDLDRPIPVHIDYYVVRVGDEGYAHFLSDLYGRDAERMGAQATREAEELVRQAAREVTAIFQMDHLWRRI